jgi:hypothetical protein
LTEALSVNVRFPCPTCEFPARVAIPGPGEWRCPDCDHRTPFTSVEVDPALTTCAVCGNAELYKKKDFPHGLGLAVLAGAFLISTITYGLYEKWPTWAILIGSAAFDGLLYLWVKDVIVCYRCNAHYRGFPSRDHHKPFELGIGERYRQEKARREQLQAENRH